jgi:catechol-2,3-dioxygenase
MAITRLNHAVLYVRDVQRSVDFYRDTLGFSVVMRMSMGNGAAFLRASGSSNDHDLGLFGIGTAASDSAAGRGTVGLYHLAWEVQTLTELAEIQQRLARMGALHGASDHSTTKALYAVDPDGLEFEVSWLVPADKLTDEVLQGRSSILPLDIDAAISEFGADTLGGIGVSIPAAV